MKKGKNANLAENKGSQRAFERERCTGEKEIGRISTIWREREGQRDIERDGTRGSVRQQTVTAALWKSEKKGEKEQNEEDDEEDAEEGSRQRNARRWRRTRCTVVAQNPKFHIINPKEPGTRNQELLNQNQVCKETKVPWYIHTVHN